MACLQAQLHHLQKLLLHLTKLQVLLLDNYWEFDDWRAQRRLNLGSLTALKQLSMQLCYSLRGGRAWGTVLVSWRSARALCCWLLGWGIAVMSALFVVVLVLRADSCMLCAVC